MVLTMFACLLAPLTVFITFFDNARSTQTGVGALRGQNTVILINERPQTKNDNIYRSNRFGTTEESSISKYIFRDLSLQPSSFTPGGRIRRLNSTFQRLLPPLHEERVLAPTALLIDCFAYWLLYRRGGEIRAPLQIRSMTSCAGGT